MSIPVTGAYTGGDVTSSRSGVTWASILAGAAVATAVSLILFVLGSALGLSTTSPWPYQGASASTIGIGAAIWLVVMQWVSSAVGGYLTGRLRVKWGGVHTNEVFFRDTAHGFLTWAVATLFVAYLVATAGAGVVGAGVNAASNVMGGAAQGTLQGAASNPQVTGQVQGALAGGPTAYFTDMLFRTDTPPATAQAGAAPGTDPRAEAGRIMLRSAGGEMSAADKAYLARLISQQTGMSQDDATKRVDAVNAEIKAAADKAREAADKARKAAATASWLGFLALLIGAFIASVSAAFGGSQRDENETIYAGEVR
jgi:hypothetical protein